VRGHKAGLLTVPDYNNLTQCEALDDIKLNLVRAQHQAPQAGQAAVGHSQISSSRGAQRMHGSFSAAMTPGSWAQRRAAVGCQGAWQLTRAACPVACAACG
jgi:hypothetical protein